MLYGLSMLSEQLRHLPVEVDHLLFEATQLTSGSAPTAWTGDATTPTYSARAGSAN